MEPAGAGSARSHGQEAADREDQQHRLGVAHDEDEGRGQQAEYPDAAPSRGTVAELAAGEDEEHGRRNQGGQVGEQNERSAVVDSGHPGEHVGQKRDGREETERLASEGRIPDPGNRLVPPGVPPQEPLVDPERHAGRRRVGPVHHEVGHAECAENDDPGHDEGPERLSQ